MIMLVTGIGFFLVLALQRISNVIQIITNVVRMDPACYWGVFRVCAKLLSKSIEILYLRYDQGIGLYPPWQRKQAQGKSGNRWRGLPLGKSGGAVFYQVLIMALGTVACTIPYVAVILLFVIAAWIWAVRSLGKRFTDLTQSQAEVREEPVLEAGVGLEQPPAKT